MSFVSPEPDDSLEERLQFHAQLLDAVGQAVIATTGMGEITYWNHGAEELFGHRAENVMGRNIVDVLPTTRPREINIRTMRSRVLGSQGVDELTIRRADGAYVSVLTYTQPIRNAAGTVTGIVGVSSDITALKAAEGALRASEERFRAIFDQAAVGVAQSDLEGHWLLVNDRFVDLYGYSREELANLRFHDITYPEDLAPDLAQFERMLRGEIDSYALEKRFFRKDGTLVWAQVHVSLVRDAEGNPKYSLAIVADISGRKEAERERLAAEARYRSVVEASPDGIALVDLQGRFLMANGQLAAMLGFEAAADLVGVSMYDHIVQDEHERAALTLKDRSSSATHLATIRDSRYDIVRRDGSTFPAEVSSFASRDENGTAMLTATVRDISEQLAHEEQVRHQVLHDTMTGLPNRALLHDRLQQTLAAARRDGEQLAVLLLNIDRFKAVNDTYGHSVGDEVLAEVGKKLGATLRESDTLARLSGDEFAILLSQADLLGALHATTKLTAALEDGIVLGEQRFHLGASIGIALYPDHGESAEALLRHADVAMYEAKESNSGYAVYSLERDSNSPMRLSLSYELRNAIQTDQLVLYFQPKLRLSTGEVDGMEALVRWNHPEHGLIPPDQFIPLAEHSGLITSLTIWVIDRALAQCRTWSDEGFDLTVAVNLSARSLHDTNLPGTIEHLLETHGVPASRLTVEITESVIMTNPEEAMRRLGRMKALGIKVSIDDFGAGYSSLAYLQHLRATELKIDKSFVMDLDSNEDNGHIVRSVVELGHNLGLEVVAEGVETQATLDVLALLACDRAQGYHLSRPAAAADITTWLRERQDQRKAADGPACVAVIEDEQDILDTLQTLLLMEGYSVITLGDPRNIEAVLASESPDVFLIDMMLPGMSGIEVAEMLRGGRFRDVPMIAMSASDLMMNTAGATRLFRALISKPFDIDKVLSAVEHAVAV